MLAAVGRERGEQRGEGPGRITTAPLLLGAVQAAGKALPRSRHFGHLLGGLGVRQVKKDRRVGAES